MRFFIRNAKTALRNTTNIVHAEMNIGDLDSTADAIARINASQGADFLTINASKCALGASKGEPCPRLVQAMLPLLFCGIPDLIDYVVSQINMCNAPLMTTDACVEFIGNLGQRQLSGQSQVKILTALTANQRK